MHLTHDHLEKVYACPECDEAHVRVRPSTCDTAYRCATCKATFDEPDERTSRLAPKYADLSLEDVGLSPAPE